jgi:hypothetical protein
MDWKYRISYLTQNHTPHAYPTLKRNKSQISKLLQMTNKTANENAKHNNSLACPTSQSYLDREKQQTNKEGKAHKREIWEGDGEINKTYNALPPGARGCKNTGKEGGKKKTEKKEKRKTIISKLIPPRFGMFP